MITDGKKVAGAKEPRGETCLGGPPLEGYTSRQWHERDKLKKRGFPQMPTQAGPGHLGEEQGGN